MKGGPESVFVLCSLPSSYNCEWHTAGALQTHERIRNAGQSKEISPLTNWCLGEGLRLRIMTGYLSEMDFVLIGSENKRH